MPDIVCFPVLWWKKMEYILWFHVTVYHSGCCGRNPEAGTEAEALEESCVLARSHSSVSLLMMQLSTNSPEVALLTVGLACWHQLLIKKRACRLSYGSTLRARFLIGAFSSWMTELVQSWQQPNQNNDLWFLSTYTPAWSLISKAQQCHQTMAPLSFIPMYYSQHSL